MFSSIFAYRSRLDKENLQLLSVYLGVSCPRLFSAQPSQVNLHISLPKFYQPCEYAVTMVVYLLEFPFADVTIIIIKIAVNKLQVV